ncbi:MAG: ATP-binding protein [Bacteroidaceae bacterium]|nr:ATP-binding protein [Bacteroidaceae bacterium]
MLSRYPQLNQEVESSIFLFGARQTGKSTLLRTQFPSATFIDLLDSELRIRFQRRPSLLYEMLREKEQGSIVVIDEIPEVPELLNEVHRLISEKGLVFVLCGSSARKLKRKGYNTLGGRAYPCYLYPLVSAEIPDFDLDRALLHGMLPTHYLSKNPRRLLNAYVDVYLREEIREEALVRNLGSFQRFLEVAALTDGEMVNYANIASDCGVSAQTIKAYFGILEDTLIGYMIPAYTKVMKRRLVQAPRFYYFDVGLTQYLLRQTSLERGTPQYGHAFEHFVIQELIAYIGYHHKDEKLAYWRTHTGIEVDVVIDEAKLAIEIKSTEEIQPRHLKGLKSFGDDYPEFRKILVSLDRINRCENDVELIYIHDFLRMLWKGELF